MEMTATRVLDLIDLASKEEAVQRTGVNVNTQIVTKADFVKIMGSVFDYPNWTDCVLTFARATPKCMRCGKKKTSWKHAHERGEAVMCDCGSVEIEFLSKKRCTIREINLCDRSFQFYDKSDSMLKNCILDNVRGIWYMSPVESNTLEELFVVNL